LSLAYTSILDKEKKILREKDIKRKRVTLLIPLRTWRHHLLSFASPVGHGAYSGSGARTPPNKLSEKKSEFNVYCNTGHNPLQHYMSLKREID
jgi:hypothetical protein